MPITTELLGRLGGKPETREVPLNIGVSRSEESIPAGWKKAVGVFEGRFTGTIAEVFGLASQQTPSTSNINGGGVLTAGETARFQSVEGTLTWYRLE